MEIYEAGNAELKALAEKVKRAGDVTIDIIHPMRAIIIKQRSGLKINPDEVVIGFKLVKELMVQLLQLQIAQEEGWGCPSASDTPTH